MISNIVDLNALSPEAKQQLLQQLLAEQAKQESSYPLSAAQQGLLFLHQFSPDDPAYNLKLALKLSGPCDVRKVRNTMEKLLRRHDTLRTVFTIGEAGTSQRVLETFTPDFRVVDASTMSDAELERQVNLIADRPFDLERTPPFRIVLFQQADDRHVLLMAGHHAVIDLWAIRVVAEDIISFYRAEIEERDAGLPPVDGGYRDYVAWQRAMLAGAEGERLRDYWENKLAGDVAALQLPCDRPRPRTPSGRSDAYAFEIPADTAKQLRKLSKDGGASVFTIYTAAYQVLLHRYCRQDDVIVGTPMLGRSRPEFQETVGFFVNTVPLRANAGGNPTFREFLAQVQTTVAEAIEHQEYPLPLMVRSLAQRRGTRHAPLIQTLIAWDRVFHVDLLRREVDGGDEHDPRMPVIEHVDVEQRGAGFDLVLFVVRDTGGVIHPRFQFNADLFDVATVRRFAECYCRLLAAAAADPDRPIDDLELSSAEELERTVVQFNRGATKTVPDVPVHRLFAAAASAKPGHVAVVHEGRTTTYGELNARADRLATLLRRRGVGRGTLVGLCIADPTAMIAAMLGVLKAGGAYLPLDPEQGADRLRLILDDARCPVVVIDAARRGMLPASSASVVDLDSDSDAADPADLPEPPPADETTLDDPAYVIYTSGSTGRPNGVLITHGNLAHSIAARISYYDRAPERFLLVMPFHFDGSVTAVYGTLARGGALVVPPADWRRRLDELPALIAANDVTDVVCIPSLWNGILQGADAAQLHSLRTVIVAGEACRRELAERHAQLTPQARLFNEYGPTEAAVWCTVHEVMPGAVGETVPIGRPIADAQVYLLDERMRPVPPGVVGELYIGGKGVARGYLNRAELTAERFVADPFSSDHTGRLYKTGDHVRLRADELLEFVGRTDQQIKVSGFRVELEEVEAAIAGLDEVAEVAVTAQALSHGDMRLTAYVAFAGPALEAMELRAKLAERLPGYMIPALFVTMPALPRTPGGKVNRRALPERARASVGELRPYVASRTPLERELAELWCEVLELPKVGVDDDFFDLGAASMQVLQFVAKAKSRGITLSTEQVFRHTTVAALARDCETSSRIGGNTVIESLGVYLPPRVVSTTEVIDGCAKKIDINLEKLSGIRSRRMAGDTEFSIDLSFKAVEECLARSRFTPDDVDLVICCNISRFDGAGTRIVFEPSTAAQVAAKFGFSNAATFDVGNACAGMFTGIMLADRLLKRGVVDCVIVVSGEYITHLTRKAQGEIETDFDPRIPCLTLGDAGAALALMRGADDKVGFHDVDLYTLGRHHGLCVAKLSDRPPPGPIMITDLLSMSEVTTKEVIKHWPTVAMRHGWGLHNVRHVIPHQVSDTTMNNGFFALKELRLTEDINVVSNVAERGNTATTTHSVAVWDQARKGVIAGGENVLFGVTGSGMTIGAALYTFDDLPERLRGPAVKPTTPHRRPSAALRRHRIAQIRRLRIDAVGLAELPTGAARGGFEAAGRAAETCLAGAAVSRNELGMLIYTGVYRDDYLSEPAAAAIIAGRIDLNAGAGDDERKAVAFDLINGAVGTLQACYVAQYAGSESGRCSALVVAAEVENNGEFPRPRPTGAAQAASAMLLAPAEADGVGFGGFAFENLLDHVDARKTETRYDLERGFLATSEYADLDELYLTAAEHAVSKLLEAEGLKPADVAHVLPPQISAAFIAKLAERLRMPVEKFIDATRDDGDLFTSALPFAWRRLQESQRVRRGDVGLIIAVGSGVQAAAATYYF